MNVLYMSLLNDTEGFSAHLLLLSLERGTPCPGRNKERAAIKSVAWTIHASASVKTAA